MTMRTRIPATTAAAAAALLSALLLSSCAIAEIEFGAGDLDITENEITTAKGSYLQTRISADSPALTETLLLQGDTTLFTDDEVLSAQHWLLHWLSEHAIDGPLLESAPGSPDHESWQQQALAEWLDPKYGPELLWDQPVTLPGLEPANSFPLIAVYDIETLGGFTVLHDGGARFAGALITLTSIQSAQYPKDGTAFLNFSGKAEYFLRITAESLATLLSAGSASSEELAKQHPEAFDEHPDMILLQFVFSYDLADFDGQWRITRIHPDQQLHFLWPIDPDLAEQSLQRITETAE